MNPNTSAHATTVVRPRLHPNCDADLVRGVDNGVRVNDVIWTLCAGELEAQVGLSPDGAACFMLKAVIVLLSRVISSRSNAFSRRRRSISILNPPIILCTSSIWI